MISIDNFILVDGKPVPECDIAKWGKWWDSADRRLAYTEITPDVYVSTVFLGINHSFERDSAPVLWETMVFRHGDGCEQMRYTSAEEAMAGHEEMVRIVRAEGGHLIEP